MPVELKICTGCMWRHEPGIVHIDLPPDHNCIGFDGCSRAWNMAKADLPDRVEVANKLRAILKGNDKEMEHIQADELICDVLRQLGYTEAVALFKEAKLWCA